jgi:hypothetical protein
MSSCVSRQRSSFSEMQALLLDHERRALRLPNPQGVFHLGRIDLDVNEPDD